MGKTFENLTWDDLCDLMCGSVEEDYDDNEVEEDEQCDNDRDTKGCSSGIRR